MERVAQQLKANHGATAVVCKAVDIGDYEALDSAVTDVIQELGHIDILINNVSWKKVRTHKYSHLPFSLSKAKTGKD